MVDEFKVGDKVVLVDIEDLDSDFKERVGTTAEMLSYQGSEQIKIRFDKDGYETNLYTRRFKLAKGHKPKVATHIVVWLRSGCGDPHQLCYSEKEAKNKVKELLSQSDTIESSVEIYPVGKKITPVTRIVFTTTIR